MKISTVGIGGKNERVVVFFSPDEFLHLGAPGWVSLRRADPATPGETRTKYILHTSKHASMPGAYTIQHPPNGKTPRVELPIRLMGSGWPLFGRAVRPFTVDVIKTSSPDTLVFIMPSDLSKLEDREPRKRVVKPKDSPPAGEDISDDMDRLIEASGDGGADEDDVWGNLEELTQSAAALRSALELFKGAVITVGKDGRSFSIDLKVKV